MKACAIRDEAISAEKDLAYLLYYEKQKRFCIELSRKIESWLFPPILDSFARRGRYTVDFRWSRRWADQRVIPRDRQNLGMILKEFGLKEYDLYTMLMIANGRCAQDECYLVPLKENDYPSELLERLKEKVSDIICPSDDRMLLMPADGTLTEISRQALCRADEQAARLLSYYQSFSALQVSPGGQGVEWNKDQIIPLDRLRRVMRPASIRRRDLISYVQMNLVNTGEAARILGCSRQNINDLVRRGRLVPVREEHNNSLFLRSDIMARQDTGVSGTGDI